MSYKDNSIKKERSLGGLDTLGKGQRRGGGGGDGQALVIELNRNLCNLCSRSFSDRAHLATCSHGRTLDQTAI